MLGKFDAYGRLFKPAGLIAILIVISCGNGCRKYEKVTSEESLNILRQLYTACSAKDPAKLTRVKERIEMAQRNGDCTAEESDAFLKVVGMAESGKWEKAAREAYRFAKDQVQ